MLRVRLAFIVCCVLVCTTAEAARIGEVAVEGLDEAMATNVRIALSLEDAKGKSVSAARLEYLLNVAEDETREALEPFGYYAPRVEIRETPALEGTSEGALETLAEDATVSVRINVDPGEPARVRNARVAIEGDGGDDRYLKQELDAFAPRTGDVFEHARYEQSKAQISRRLAERGYFDADFRTRQVDVTRAEQAADIDLVWESGDRYAMGEVRFVQSPKPAIRDSVLQELIYWKQGEYYHQGRLDRLRKGLSELDYFSRIDIEPMLEQAVDGQVPIEVRLTPAKRSIYSVGGSYGTDSGFGVSLGLERRYLNSRGHKGLAQLDYTEKRKTLTVQHRIPAFAWRDGWYTTSLQAYDEQTDYIDTRRYEAVFSRTAEYNRQLNLTASLHVLRERWAYAYSDTTVFDSATLYQQSTFLYPSLQAEYLNADDRIRPRRGIGGTAVLRGGVKALGSDADFLQLHVRGSWFQGLGARSRLIVRGEIGATYTDSLVGDALLDIPPTLRFYAGGDRSVRGYDFREIGPRIPAAPGREAFALGARNVVTTSVEYEHYLNDTWGFAAFVDGGSAFDDRIDAWRKGIGLGLRWNSPIGPLRVDVARGLDDPDASFTLHINLGADL
jgi:translocation and assembly module TamA